MRRRLAAAAAVVLVLAGCGSKEQATTVRMTGLLAPIAPAAVRVKRPLLSRWFGRRFDRTLMKDQYRAVPLPIDSYQLANVRTADRVDVLCVFEAINAGGAQEKVSATVLQNVEVLGVRGAKQGEKGTLTLRLNPIEAQYAVLALKQSDLFIAVRHEGDIETHPLEMATFRRLFR